MQNSELCEGNAQFQLAGRSAPRLVEDILRFHLGTRYFALTPLNAGKNPILGPHYNAVTIQSHHLVHYQSTPYGSSLYSLLLDLKSCCHFFLELVGGVPLSPGEMYDFHLLETNSALQEKSDIELYEYRCSVTNAKLKLTFKGQDFTPEDLRDFEPAAIHERFERYKEEYPEEYANYKKSRPEGDPQPFACFATLFKIIDRPLNAIEASNIYAGNATLNSRVNPAILSKLNFQFDETNNIWIPPDVYDPATEEELEIQKSLIHKQHETAFHIHRLHMNQPPYIFNQMVNIINRILRCDSYPRPGIQISELTSTQYGAYVTLGAVEDFSDSLIISCFELQSMHDPSNKSFYFDALKVIAQHRNSEEIEMKVMELMSLGVISGSDLTSAYKLFNLSVGSYIDEDLLIDTYRQFVKDQPSSRKSVRDALKIVSNHLESEKITSFLHSDLMSLDEAYNELGISSSINNDEIIHLAYETKMQESTPEDEFTLHNALLVIAKFRLSDYLLALYETAVAKIIPPMPLSHAHTIMGSDEHTKPADLIEIFKLKLKDSPEEIIELRQALREIGSNLKSKKITAFLSGNIDQDVEKNKSWPVGLENIGNTCYLNSLLQYYFTITPLRNSVMSFVSQPRNEGSSESPVEKRVGGRAVTKAEVLRSKEFVNNLAGLFQNLIHTPKSAISPQRDLAYLALVPPWEDSTFTTDQDGVLESNNDAQTSLDVYDQSDDDELHPTTSIIIHSDSLGTIPSINDQEGGIITAKSPVSSMHDKPIYLISNTSDVELSDDEYSSDSEEEDRAIHTQESLNSNSEVKIYSPQPSFDAPPPLPPRYEDHNFGDSKAPIVTVKRIESSIKKRPVTDSSLDEKKRKIDNTLFGRQQDVTECIGNVLFQIEAAFEPTGFDSDGEQIDLVKDLFYGKTKQTLASEKDGSNHREKTERFSSLLVDVASGPRDLYDALDSYFGVDIMKLEDVDTRRTVTITQAPPILQIQIQRVQFNRELGQAFKSTALLRFDETIYLDRYLDSNDPDLIRKRREVSEWRIEVARLQKKLLKLNSPAVSMEDSSRGFSNSYRIMASALKTA